MSRPSDLDKDLQRRLSGLVPNTKKTNRQIQDIKKRAKPLHELILEEEFVVYGVCTTAHETSITPVSEVVIGGKVPRYDGGFNLMTVLDVATRDTVIPILPVIRLNFAGFSPVRVGEVISAKIPRYESWAVIENGSFPRIYKPGSEIGTLSRDLRDISRLEKVLYVARKLKRKETAIELSILDSNGKVLRVDRAIDYDRYQKKKP